MTVKSIAGWDGCEWTNFDNGLSGIPYGVETFGNIMYVGGNFSDASGVTDTRYLARWTGMEWQAVGNIGPSNSDVRCLKSYDSLLYIGGFFSQINFQQFPSVGAFNGIGWINNGGPDDWGPYAFEVYNGELYAGGLFYSAGGGIPGTSHIARWDGSQWKSVGGGLNAPVKSFAIDSINDFIYVGGSFTLTGDSTPVRMIVVWDGDSWYDVGGGVNSDITDVAIYRGDLYVGGYMSEAGGIPVNYLARWDGIKWDSIGSGVTATTLALEVYKDELYAGGHFDTAGSQRAYGLSRWYMPPGYNCNMLQPRIRCSEDTVWLVQGQAQVQFYNNNAYSEYWQWDFGDGGTGTVQNPLHTYTQAGTFVVMVTVKYEECIRYAEKVITVLQGTGMEGATKEALGFRLYPNPAGTEFTIEAELPYNSSGYVSVLGLQGCEKIRLGLNGGRNRLVVPVSGWQAGTYLCNLTVDARYLGLERLVVGR
ncbi:MAG: PKD domain-containing protein [Bacteroidetes bacterium]|nr:PKD domain-containing protein [Bacteroidota bacterium]